MDRRGFGSGGDRRHGQATVEWLGLVALVALALGSSLWAAGSSATALSVPHAVLERLVCAARLSEDCRHEPKLSAAHGDEISHLLRAHAPALFYERGMSALPVDYRRCRADACAAGDEAGQVTRTRAAQPVAAFTHVIDCRDGARAETEAAGAECAGPRAGNLYLQYWFYYPGSATAEGSTPLKGVIRRASSALGRPTYHPDDWESYQVRIGPGGERSARASSHHGYGAGWVPDADALRVSGGSHAGEARADRLAARTTKDGRLRLIPLRRIRARERSGFAVSPPWLKRVFDDPEYGGTD